MKHVKGWTDTAAPLCIHFVHFVQRIHKTVKIKICTTLILSVFCKRETWFHSEKKASMRMLQDKVIRDIWTWEGDELENVDNFMHRTKDMPTIFSLENIKGTYHLWTIGINGKITLKCILEKQRNCDNFVTCQITAPVLCEEPYDNWVVQIYDKHMSNSCP